MEEFDKLGSFYLGKKFDIKKNELTNNYLLYDSKNFTTHAVCVGMTGSGKTGLGIDIIEEAALDGIPSILIDPKGDLGNLLLTFPNLSPEEFFPWVDLSEAERQKMSKEDFAKKTATEWKEGLSRWGETEDRIRKLKNMVDMVIYTPASQAGIPLSILGSFEAPSKEIILDKNALLERVQSITSSLLGLIGIDADPVKSREHILLCNIINESWLDNKNLDLASLIQQVQKPPFDKIGALDLETFYPQKERKALSVSLNGLLASPGFQLWLEGDSLDIQKLLYTDLGKPKVSIISIAHLTDSERMFFVTLLLNQMIVWMRKQPGTSSLRALFYMDEIFGFFPPTLQPPSKLPMLTMLKQARAYGLGIILSTQNPVDLDYKGLSNCGTWFIGKLQTERDKARILEGLNAASNGEFDSKTLGDLLGTIGKRIFIMRSIYEKEPIIFETRWTMSYLRGPLTLTQIQSLTPKKLLNNSSKKEEHSSKETKPYVPSSIKEYFYNQKSKSLHYTPVLLGSVKLHFVDSKVKIDTWKEYVMLDPDCTANTWESQDLEIKKWFSNTPLEGSSFDEIPVNLLNEKNYANFNKLLGFYLYQNETLSIYKYDELNLISNLKESETDFRLRIMHLNREERDNKIQKIKDQYSKKIDALSLKIKNAESKYNEKKEKSLWQKIEAFISVAATVIGSLLGKGVTKGTINSAGTSMRRVSKIGKESQDVERAENAYQNLTEQLHALNQEMNDEINRIEVIDDPSKLQIEIYEIKPRKSDINVEEVAILWK